MLATPSHPHQLEADFAQAGDLGTKGQELPPILQIGKKHRPVFSRLWEQKENSETH